MKLTIAPSVFTRFHPDFKVAFILVKNIDNKTKLKESQHLLQEAERLVHLTFNQETIANHYLLSAWAVSREEFRKQAQRCHTAVEKLLQQVLDKKKISSQDVVTNVVHFLALKFIAPISVDDPEKLKGTITFSLTAEKEKSPILKNLPAGTLYYKDAKQVLGTKMDYWKNPATMLTAQSKAALIHFEALPPLAKPQLAYLIQEAVALLKSFCGGDITVAILDKKKNSANI